MNARKSRTADSDPNSTWIKTALRPNPGAERFYVALPGPAVLGVQYAMPNWRRKQSWRDSEARKTPEIQTKIGNSSEIHLKRMVIEYLAVKEPVVVLVPRNDDSSVEVLDNCPVATAVARKDESQ